MSFFWIDPTEGFAEKKKSLCCFFKTHFMIHFFCIILHDFVFFGALCLICIIVFKNHSLFFFCIGLSKFQRKTCFFEHLACDYFIYIFLLFLFFGISISVIFWIIAIDDKTMNSSLSWILQQCVDFGKTDLLSC